MSSPGVLVLGNYSQTVTVIRSLGHAGFPVVLGTSPEHGRVFTWYSRYTSEIWLHPSIKQSETEFIDALAAFLEQRPDIGHVFPVWEAQVSCLIRHRDRLPPHLVLVMAEPAAVTACLDKFRLYEVAASLGIPHMSPHKVTGLDMLLSLADSLGYPCVVKNNDSFSGLFGKKAVIAGTREELLKSVPAWPERTGFLVLQKFASGFRHNCHFMADRGRLTSYFEQRVLRTDMPDGTGYGVESLSLAPVPRHREYTAALIRALEYSGPGCAQFLVDDANATVTFLELNPRLDATCAMPLYCGYDFPLVAMRYAVFRQGGSSGFEPNDKPYPAGKRGVCLWGDLNGWMRELRKGGLGWRKSLAWVGRAMRMSWRGDVDYIWSWTDPLPGLFMYAELGRRMLRYFFRTITGQFRSD